MSREDYKHRRFFLLQVSFIIYIYAFLLFLVTSFTNIWKSIFLKLCIEMNTPIVVFFLPFSFWGFLNVLYTVVVQYMFFFLFCKLIINMYICSSSSLYQCKKMQIAGIKPYVNIVTKYIPQVGAKITREAPSFQEWVSECMGSRAGILEALWNFKFRQNLEPGQQACRRHFPNKPWVRYLTSQVWSLLEKSKSLRIRAQFSSCTVYCVCYHKVNKTINVIISILC